MSSAKKLLESIRSGRIANQEQLEQEKIKLAAGAPLVKNSDIASLLSPNDKDYDSLRHFLKIKNIRTASGVANIAVMWLYKEHENSCPFSCIYCPQGASADAKGVTRLIAPKSYTGVEPTTLRAIRNDYDPFLQVSNRIRQLNLIGHSTDKCELIIMGGTLMATSKKFRESFVKSCLDAFNEKESTNLREAQLLNETAQNRCIGLTIETRADYCSEKQIDEMLSLGCTRVEIGVQATDDALLKETKRGHAVKANVDAIKRLKEAGLKVCVHWMPGLTGLHGLDEKKEIEMFKQLFTSDYMPDELKIYPTLVIPGTELHALWKEGKYTPLTRDQMIRLLIEFKNIVPEFVRIKRVMRDISEHKAEAGAKTTNLRQLAAMEMKRQGVKCRCIRCREVGHTSSSQKDILIKETSYEASGGKEIFISCESDSLLGFLRLRLDNQKDVIRPARIRELHVYGEVTPIGQASRQAQHTGIGKALMERAENLAKDAGAKIITVTSGIGVRPYYARLGYQFEAPYMVKSL